MQDPDGRNDLSIPFSRVEKASGKVLRPKTAEGRNKVFNAVFIDTEGNKVGLHSIG